MEKITKDQHIFVMSEENEPVLRVQSGAEVIFESLDCFSNQIQSEDQALDAIDYDTINPATGPLYVEGAEVGDLLKVTIQALDLEEQGVAMAIKDFGVLGAEMSKGQARLIKYQDGRLRMGDVSIPSCPMIGVIGTAPAGEGVMTGTPADHGGNLDNTAIQAGTTIYFPVNTPGALLAMGDFHLAMGDGEICGTGVEVPGEATVKVEVLKGSPLPALSMETADDWLTMGAANSHAEAIQKACQAMLALIQAKTKLSKEDAHILMSIAGNLEVCQVVNPNMSYRMRLAKAILEK